MLTEFLVRSLSRVFKHRLRYFDWDLQHCAERSGPARAGLAHDPERDAAAHHLDGVSAPAPAADGVAADERREGGERE
jgi:hypothetical protein